MNRGKEALETIKLWVQKSGPDVVKVKLVTLGVGLSTADKLVNGRYESTPGYELADKIIDGANSCGVSFTDEGAA